MRSWRLLSLQLTSSSQKVTLSDNEWRSFRWTRRVYVEGDPGEHSRHLFNDVLRRSRMIYTMLNSFKLTREFLLAELQMSLYLHTKRNYKMVLINPANHTRRKFVVFEFHSLNFVSKHLTVSLLTYAGREQKFNPSSICGIRRQCEKFFWGAGKKVLCCQKRKQISEKKVL